MILCPIVSRAITSRTVDGQQWQYHYEVPLPAGETVQAIYSTEVTSPSGVKTLSVHGAHGMLMLRRVTSAAGTLLEREERTYDTRTVPGTFPQLMHLLTNVELARDGLTFRTQHDYSWTDRLKDYGRPKTTTETANDGATRVTHRTFGGGTVASEPVSFWRIPKVVDESVDVRDQTLERSWVHNAAGFTTSETVSGLTTNFTPDARGNLFRLQKGNGEWTEFSYAHGVVSEIRTPAHTTTRQVNPEGTVASQTQAGRTTAFQYDDLFRVTQSSPPSGNPIVTIYESPTAVKVSRGNTWTRTSFDTQGRPVSTVNALGITTATAYDNEGRIKSESLPGQGTAGPKTDIEYDWLGRIKKRTHPDSSYVEFDYGPSVVSVRDEKGRITTQHFQGFSPDDMELVSLRDAANGDWAYTYNGRGQLTQVTAPDSKTRTWAYDADGLLSEERHPESGIVEYLEYDGAGNLKRKKDANETEFTYDYDLNGRLRHTKASGQMGVREITIEYEDGSDNRSAAIVHDGVRTEFDYDAAGRLERRSDAVPGQPAYAQSFIYDANDNLRDITYPSGRVVRYDYDDANRITSVTEVTEGNTTTNNKTYASNFSYHPSGAVTSYQTGNGLVHTFEYEPYRLWPKKIKVGNLMELSYNNYDEVGNVGRIDDSRPGLNQEFEYDDLDRLTQAEANYGFITYRYDFHGNRQDAGGTSYEYDPPTMRLKKQITNTLTEEFTYDNNGNLKTGTLHGASYDYTPDNLLASSSVGGDDASYRYDADGWRVSKTSSGTSVYLRGPNGQLMSEMRPSTKRDYIYAGSRMIAMIRNTEGGTEVNQTPPAPKPSPAPQGTKLFGFAAQSLTSADLQTATLERAPENTNCTETLDVGCSWTSVDVAAAPPRVTTWNDSTALDDLPPAGGTFLYKVVVSDIDGAIGEGSPVSVTTIDDSPDTINIPDKTGVATGQPTNSAIAQITGLAGDIAVSVSGAGLFRVCTENTCTAGGPVFGTTGNITNNKYLQLQIAASASLNTPVTTTVTVGSGAHTWSVTTTSTAPAPTVRSSSQAAFSGSGTTNTLTINKPTGTIANDVMVAAIVMRPLSATVTPPTGWTEIHQSAGNVPKLITYWKVASGSEPASYQWTIGNSPSNIVGGIVSVVGVRVSGPVDVAAGQSVAASLAFPTPNITTTVHNDLLLSVHTFATSASWSGPSGMTEAVDLASLTVPNDSGISIAMFHGAKATAGATGALTATASYGADVGNTQIIALVPAGGTPAPDTTPEGLVFTDQTNATAGTEVKSSILQVTGINTTVSAMISGGGGSYRICPDATCTATPVPSFITTTSSVVAGQYVQVRVNAGAGYGAVVNTTMTVGSASDQWSVTTATQDTTPNEFTFTNQGNVPLNTDTSSNTLQVSGIQGSVNVSVSGGATREYRVCADSSCSGVGWTSTGGTIVNNQYLQLRVNSGGANGQVLGVTATVGTYSTTWLVTTINDPCAGAPAAGTTCADGSKFAGYSPDGGGKMFTTTSDYGYQAFAWPETYHGVSNWNTGRANTSALAANGNYHAANACQNLTANGKTDWYLPSPNEMNALDPNRAAIGNFEEDGVLYWTSAQMDGGEWSGGIYHVMGSDFNGYTGQGLWFAIRCVRRD